MSKVPDVIGGEPIEADWGNNSIRDRTVQRMDDEADRDASIPAPEIGETVYIEDIQELQTWRGTDWMPYISSFGGSVDVDVDAGHGGLFIDYTPLADNHAVPKSYVDTKLALSGGTMTNDLSMGMNLIVDIEPFKEAFGVQGGAGIVAMQADTVTVTLQATGVTDDIIGIVPSRYMIQVGATFMLAAITATDGSSKNGTVTLRLFPSGNIQIYSVPQDWVANSDVVRFTGTWIVGAEGV